ncbi:MAG: hypothetical protein OXE02_14020 [Chloroflexi bacterium]|nr:hypothetical protein [Chloroflexota bacterium]
MPNRDGRAPAERLAETGAFAVDGTRHRDRRGAAYTLTPDDAGGAVKVRVSFTDDAGYDESRTSGTTGAVEQTVPGKPRDLDGISSA